MPFASVFSLIFSFFPKLAFSSRENHHPHVVVVAACSSAKYSAPARIFYSFSPQKSTACVPSGAQSARLPSILHLLGFFILFPRKRVQLACHQELSLLVCNIIPISATPHLCLCPQSLPAKLSLLPLFLFYKNIYGLLSACFYPRSTLTAPRSLSQFLCSTLVVPSQPLAVLSILSQYSQYFRSTLNTFAVLSILSQYSQPLAVLLILSQNFADCCLFPRCFLPSHYRITTVSRRIKTMPLLCFFCVLLYVFLCPPLCLLVSFFMSFCALFFMFFLLSFLCSSILFFIFVVFYLSHSFFFRIFAGCFL